MQMSTEEMESPAWHDAKSHEPEPSDREAGIKIQNLSKTYIPVRLTFVHIHNYHMTLYFMGVNFHEYIFF